MGTAIPQVSAAEKKEPKTAYLVKEGRPLKAAIISAENSLSGKDYQVSAAEVVVVGPAVKALRKGSELEEDILNSLEQGVRTVACQMAMKNTGVKAENLIEGVKTVPNGFFEIFRLQEKGYLTIQL